MTRRAAIAAMCSSAIARSTCISWRKIPDLPRALGGQFAGRAGEFVAVGGGSYFKTPPWSGGAKQRVDSVYISAKDSESWIDAGRLPFPVASGAAASVPEGLLCTGGQRSDGTSNSCLLLTIQNGKLRVEPWQDLPMSLSMHAAAASQNHVYVAGGQETLQATKAVSSFWRAPVDGAKRTWEHLPDLPVCGRILPVLICQGDAVYLFSGAELTGTPGPPPGRRFLADAYRFRDASGWEPIAPPPRAIQGGCGFSCRGSLYIFSGNDGEFADREYQLRERHPGFSRDVLCCDPQSNEWSVAGEMPAGLVTTGVAAWDNEFVIPGGEIRPGFRSSTVLAGRIQVR